MRSIVALICAIAAVAALFMPWFNLDMASSKVHYSGWDVLSGDLGGWVGTNGPLLVLVGAILLAAAALASGIMGRLGSPLSIVPQLLPIMARTGAGLALFGATWSLIDANNAEDVTVDLWDRLEYGPWVAIVPSILALFIGVTRPFPRWATSHVDEIDDEERQAAKPIRPRYEDEESDTTPALTPAGETPADDTHTSSPSFAKRLFDRAVDFESTGQYDEAITSYTEAIRRDPSYALAYYNRALLYVRHALKDNAIEDFGKVAELSDDTYLVHLAQKRIVELNSPGDQGGEEAT